MMLDTLYRPVTRVLIVFSPERPKVLEGAHSFIFMVCCRLVLGWWSTDRTMMLEGFLERKVG
jgi:hypothetical protein